MPKPRKKQTKPIATATIYHCKDCANSYDWHSKALDGHLILCRCPHKQEGVAIVYFLMTHNVSILQYIIKLIYVSKKPKSTKLGKNSVL